MKKSIRKTILLSCAAIAAAAVLVALFFWRSSEGEGKQDSLRSIRETVQQLALQCYVIEGAYPESLEYLTENYGLAVNQEDFLIVYTPFAENLPPDVRVLDRKGEEK